MLTEFVYSPDILQGGEKKHMNILSSSITAPALNLVPFAPHWQ